MQHRQAADLVGEHQRAASAMGSIGSTVVGIGRHAVGAHLDVVEDEVVIPLLADDKGRVGRSAQVAVGDDAHQAAAVYHRQAPESRLRASG